VSDPNSFFFQFFFLLAFLGLTGAKRLHAPELWVTKFTNRSPFAAVNLLGI
jgi:hypothetical protein